MARSLDKINSTVLVKMVIVFFITTATIGLVTAMACGEQNIDSETENGTFFTRASNPPRLEIDKSINRDQIFINGSGVTPEEATVTITVNGLGFPGVEFNAQDTVFIMDNSDSMDENDNEFRRLEALQLYLQKMIAPEDRAAIVKFSAGAELINNHHLTSNYTQIIEDLPELWHTSGLTNLGAAVALANQELIAYGDKNKVLVEILLTDGRPEPPENNVTIDIINDAVENNIEIYTVGLGEAHDAGLLKWIARQTGGKYYYAKNASELIDIYNDISNQFRNFTAGSDPDLKDSEPLIRDVIPTWITFDPNSFTKKPDYIGAYLGGTTKIEWNVSKISIGETWSVSYNISSTTIGDAVAITVYGHARVRYFTQERIYQQLLFDDDYIIVLPGYGRLLPGPPIPPPPAPPPPPPPASGFPIPVAPSSTPVPLPIQPSIYVPAGTPAAIPAEAVFAGFLTLGVADRIRQRRILKTRQKVAIGV